MDIALTGVWDDRAAQMRGLAGETAGAVLVLWRGRPLVSGEGAARRLVWLSPDSPILRQAAPGRLWLGRHAGAGRAAADLSDWEPAALDRAAMAMFLDPTEYAHPDLPDDHRFVDMRQLLLRLPADEAALAGTARALFNWHRTHRFCSACGAPSDWVQDGWQRKCPACGASHFPRTDPVVIMLVVRDNRVLLGRSPGWPEGMYSALAGFVEPGETLEDAVRREVAEETGIRVGAVRYVASQPWPWPSSLMLGFVAEAETDAIRRDDELEDALWLSREEGVAVMAGLHPRVKRPRPGAIAHGLLSGWLTGRI
jgi:NAD+ diphosphatase